MRKTVLCLILVNLGALGLCYTATEVPNAKQCDLDKGGYIGKDYKCLDPDNMLDEAVGEAGEVLIVCKCPKETDCYETGSIGNTKRYFCKKIPINTKNSGLNLDGVEKTKNTTENQ